MSGSCSCAQHVMMLSQQISVMRKEIQNLRKKVDGAILSHKKHLSHLQAALTTLDQKGAILRAENPQKEAATKGLSLEQGNIETVPIGYISSCFSAKNGTPRQPTVCRPSRATLRIQKAVFNNPEHALVGLEHYSHIWIIFLFHKNGHLSYKAKVKPPRLNGQRVGLYSTRSPHRPNALGLTLAKLDKITGDTLHLSGIDIISGTPVVDIKPYIPDYDCPQSRGDLDEEECLSDYMTEGSVMTAHETTYSADKEEGQHTWGNVEQELRVDPDTGMVPSKLFPRVCDSRPSNAPEVTEGGAITSLIQEMENYISCTRDFTQETVEGNFEVTDCQNAKASEVQRPKPGIEVWYGEESYSTIASWIREPPANRLVVRFTQHAEKELAEFQPPDHTVPGKPSFQFLRGPEEAVAAIRAVLAADPRSVYRRDRCQDKLFFFTLDRADITCWFGEDFAEVLQVRAVETQRDATVGS